MEKMITDLFLNLLNLSISATWVILAVVLLRLIFKKAPKWVSCLLWAIAGLRLVFPFSIESVFSLIPSAQTVPPQIIYDEVPQINSGIPALNSVVNPVIGGTFAATPGASVNPMQVLSIVGAYLWIIGLCVMVIYALISFLSLKYKLRTATLFRDNIFQSENVDSPFVLGLFRPKIYLSYNMKPREMFLVVSHEKAHIKRRDHFIKPLAYIILCVYWFNPAVWLAYILLCRDIEMACDEKVIKEMDKDSRKDYSEALLTCSIRRRSIAACPLAFGEVGVKDRIKGVMNYKKPAFWVIVIAAVSCIIAAVCFLTNPPTDKDINLFGASYEGELVYTSHSFSGGGTVYMGICEIDTDGNVQTLFKGKTTYLGKLSESDYTREELYNGIFEKERENVEIGEFIKVFEVETEENRHIVFTTDEGKVFQAVVDENKKIPALFELKQKLNFGQKYQRIDDAVGSAVMENKKGSYYLANAMKNDETVDIALSVESHHILHTAKDDEKQLLTVYAQVLYHEYIKQDGIVTQVAAGAAPAKIEFDIVQEGVYKLRSYREYEKEMPEDMEKLFRQNPSYDEQEVMMELRRDCYEKAVESLGSFGDYQNAYIAYRYLCMTGFLSYVPEEYARHFLFNFDGETLSVTDGSGDLQNGEKIVYESKYSDVSTYTEEDIEKLLINNVNIVWARTDTKDVLNNLFTVYTFPDEKGKTEYTLLCEDRKNVRFFVHGELEGIFRLYEAIDKNVYINR